MCLFFELIGFHRFLFEKINKQNKKKKKKKRNTDKIKSFYYFGNVIFFSLRMDYHEN